VPYLGGPPGGGHPVPLVGPPAVAGWRTPGRAARAAWATTLGHMTEGPSLSLAEHAILAVLSERPTHGFAIARLTAPGGELGQIWHIPRPVVYRSLGRLQDAGLITPAAVESGRGPQRTIYTATAPGRQAAAPSAKPAPTPSVPNGPGSSQVRGPRGWRM